MLFKIAAQTSFGYPKIPADLFGPSSLFNTQSKAGFFRRLCDLDHILKRNNAVQSRLQVNSSACLMKFELMVALVCLYKAIIIRSPTGKLKIHIFSHH